MVKAATTVPIPSPLICPRPNPVRAADYIEADLDFWICHRSDLGQLPWEKVSRDNRHFAAVGNSDSNTDQNVACNKIENSPANCCRKNIYP